MASVKNHHRLSDLKEQVCAFIALEVRSLGMGSPEPKLQCRWCGAPPPAALLAAVGALWLVAASL